jgi:hypothetical protein
LARFWQVAEQNRLGRPVVGTVNGCPQVWQAAVIKLPFEIEGFSIEGFSPGGYHAALGKSG